jgi:hypothetical protein
VAITLVNFGANATGTTSLSVANPASIQNGDLLIAFILDHATSGSTAGATGWTRRLGAGGTGGRFQVFTAIQGAGGLGAGPHAWSGLTTRAQGRIIAYRGVDNATPMDVAGSHRQNASGTTGTTTITPVTAGNMIVGGFAALASGATWTVEAVATNPGSLAEQFDNANSTYCSIACAHNLQSSAGATGASSATMSANGANVGVLLSLRPLLTQYVPSKMHIQRLMRR